MKFFKSTKVLALAIIATSTSLQATNYYCTTTAIGTGISGATAYNQWVNASSVVQTAWGTATDTYYFGYDPGTITIKANAKGMIANTFSIPGTLIQVAGEIRANGSNLAIAGATPSTYKLQGGTLLMIPTSLAYKFAAGLSTGAGHIVLEGGTATFDGDSNQLLWGGLAFNTNNGGRKSTITISGTAVVTAGWIGDSVAATGEVGNYFFLGGTTTVAGNMTGCFKTSQIDPDTNNKFIFTFSGGIINVTGSFDLTSAIAIYSPINFTLNSTAVLTAGTVTHRVAHTDTKTASTFLSLWDNDLLAYNGILKSGYVGDEQNFTNWFQETVNPGVSRTLQIATIPEPAAFVLLGVSLLVVTVLRKQHSYNFSKS